mmetsp:Transcript_75684/g.233692  ORF Transcript_75684/g.233692 Transcript_75684/m.233692 type:complete len:368 (+) Transcript_75684:378-1481(+)
MSARAKCPTSGQAQRRRSSAPSGRSVPKVEGTEKRRATATRPVKAARPRRSAAVSSPLPSMQMPARARTRSLPGAARPWRQASRGAAAARMRSRRDARCPAKSRCRSIRHSRTGRPAAGSSRGRCRLSGPMKEALHTTRRAPQAARAAVSASVERRSVSTSSLRGAPCRSAPSCATEGASARQRPSEVADLSGGKETARPRSAPSGARPRSPPPAGPAVGVRSISASASSSVAQPRSPRSATIVSTDCQWIPETTARAALDERSLATPRTWCTRLRESWGHESCVAVADDAPNHWRASRACKNGSTESATNRPKDEEAKLRRRSSRAIWRRRRSWRLHLLCSSRICSLSSRARLPSSSSRRMSSASL